MRRVSSNYEGIIAGAVATVLAAFIGWLTAHTTTRAQLRGQLTTARLSADEAERKRVDDATAWVVGELRKEIDRLNTKVTEQQTQLDAQARRIDQLDAYTIRLRRTLAEHGLEAPAC